jgi:hypothetical protein
MFSRSRVPANLRAMWSVLAVLPFLLPQEPPTPQEPEEPEFTSLVPS